jgi:hypothetical protein
MMCTFRTVNKDCVLETKQLQCLLDYHMLKLIPEAEGQLINLLKSNVSSPGRTREE